MAQCNWVGTNNTPSDVYGNRLWRCTLPMGHDEIHKNPNIVKEGSSWTELFCMWQGAVGRCVLPFGHDGEHKEHIEHNKE